MDDIRAKGLKIKSVDQIPRDIKNIPDIKQVNQALGRLKEGQMNKTEAAYANYLTVQKNIGEVLWFAFEPMNLRLAGKCFFKVDFLVLTKEFRLEVHEVKGDFITDDALVKIKVAAEKFPFKFMIKQLSKGVWSTREF